MNSKEQTILDSFGYRAPQADQIRRYKAIDEAIKKAAEEIIKLAPECADRTHALRCLRDARMWANASIALEGLI